MSSPVVFLLVLTLALDLLVASIVVLRGLANLRAWYWRKLERRIEPDLLNLLVEPKFDRLRRYRGFLARRVMKRLMLRQAAELEGDDREIMTQGFLTLRLVDEAIRKLRTGRWGARVQAATDLGMMRSKRAADILESALSDKSEFVRLAALRSLGELKESERILRFLESDDIASSWPPGRFVETLLASGNVRADNAATTLQHAKTSIARQAAIQICGFVQATGAVPFLLKALESDDVEERVLAAQALGRIGDPFAIDALAARLEDPDGGVRSAVVEAISRFGDPSSVERLKELLDDPEPDVRRNVAQGLYMIGGPGVQTLADLAKGNDSLSERAAGQILAEKALGL